VIVPPGFSYQEPDVIPQVVSLEEAIAISSTSNKPSQAEIDMVIDALKYLRINPEVCMGVIYKFWNNVKAALDRVREGIRDG